MNLQPLRTLSLPNNQLTLRPIRTGTGLGLGWNLVWNLVCNLSWTCRLSLVLSLVMSLVMSLTLILWPISSNAQDSKSFPNKPVHLVIGFSAGGGSDSTARVLIPKLTELLGQTIIIENRPGAGGNLASDYVAKAQPDGYTIMLTTIGSLAINPHMPGGTNFNPLKDFTFLSQGVIFPNVLVVKSDSAIKSFKDYVEAGKKPGSFITFGSSGQGSTGHLAGELLKVRSGMGGQHVNYKGGGPAMTDLLGGNIVAIFASAPTAIPFVEAGKLRALATTGSKRTDSLPNVPTVSEQGYPGYQAQNWYAFIGPAKIPTEIQMRLNQALVGTLKDPGTVERLRNIGVEPSPSTPAELAAYTNSEYETWGKIIKSIQWEK